MSFLARCGVTSVDGPRGECAPPVMLRHFGKGGEGIHGYPPAQFLMRQGTDLANAGLSRASEGRVCGLPMRCREQECPNGVVLADD